MSFTVLSIAKIYHKKIDKYLLKCFTVLAVEKIVEKADIAHEKYY